MEAGKLPARRHAHGCRTARRLRACVLDIALPQLAPPVASRSRGAGLCAACWSKLSFIAPPYCERLGIPFPFDAGPGLLSMEAIADPPAYQPGARRGALRRRRRARSCMP